MIVLRRSPALRIACLVLALGVHAAVATAFIGGASKEPAPPPEVELEILAAVTSEATPVEMPEVTADATQASQASEAVSGDLANVVSDSPEEVSSIAPVEAVTPRDPTVTNETVEQETPVETAPRENVSMDSQPQTMIEIEATQRVEAAQQAVEMAPVEPPAVVPPIDLETPAVEAEEAPKLAALTTPLEIVEETPRVIDAEPVTSKAANEPAKRKPAKQAKAKSATAKSAAQPKAQRQMTAGSRQSKVAQREGKSTAKHSGGRMASSTYRSIVQARLSARKSALQPALRPGSKGYVVVSFSIGASGRVTSASVVTSSGVGVIDSAARAMVASTVFPPPPGGRFSARLPVMVK